MLGQQCSLQAPARAPLADLFNVAQRHCAEMRRNNETILHSPRNLAPGRRSSAQRAAQASGSRPNPRPNPMTKPLALLLLAVLPLAAQNTLGQAAQSGSTIDLSAATITKPFTIVSGTPSGSCSTPNAFEWSTATPTLYVCYSGTWHPYNSGGGGSMVY